MILNSLLVYLPAIFAGFGLIHLLWDERSNAWALPLKAFLGIGLGLGITSCIYFFRLILFPGQGGYLGIELVFLFLVLLALIWKRRFFTIPILQLNTLSWFKVPFHLIALLVLFIAISYSITFARVMPHGDYDAQAIWNLRARSIYRSGDAWENAFSPEINRNFHMDYPLLIPLNVVGGWNTLGGEILRIPAVQSMLFLYGMAGITYFLLAYARSGSQASLASIVLLSTSSLLLYTSFQTADVAIAYYFLATLTFLFLAADENNPRLLFFAGTTSALSAWTKNEGVSFVLIAALTAWFIARKLLWNHGFRNFVLGLILPLAAILAFKLYLPASHANDLFAGNEISSILPRLFDPARYVLIASRFISELSQLGGWRFSIIVILAIYGLVIGGKKDDTIQNHLFLPPLLQLAVYFGVYLITPYDPAWHMNYSFSRLLIHLFPMALLLFFLFINTPEDALGSSTKHKQNQGIEVK